MVLKRVEIEAQKYPYILKSDGTLDMYPLEILKAPDYVIQIYKDYAANKMDIKDSRFWSSENLDDKINKYLKDNNITKDKLHSIETKDGNIFQGKRGVIIYEA